MWSIIFQPELFYIEFVFQVCGVWTGRRRPFTLPCSSLYSILLTAISLRTSPPPSRFTAHLRYRSLFARLRSHRTSPQASAFARRRSPPPPPTHASTTVHLRRRTNSFGAGGKLVHPRIGMRLERNSERFWRRVTRSTGP